MTTVVKCDPPNGNTYVRYRDKIYIRGYHYPIEDVPAFEEAMKQAVESLELPLKVEGGISERYEK